jgi:hypothetical protein
MLSARRAAARLRGKQQEVGLLELHETAEARLKAWLSWVDSRRSLEIPSQSTGSQVGDSVILIAQSSLKCF